MSIGPPHRLLAISMGLAAFFGLLCGWFIGPPMTQIGWIGEFFLRCLKMIIVPLVICSMIVGIGMLGDVRRLGKTGRWTLFYYFLTTGLAVLLGIAMVTLFSPGVGVDISGIEVPETISKTKEYGISDFFLSLLWPNIFDAMAETKLLPVILFSLIFGGIASTMGEPGKQLLAHVKTANEIIMQMVGLILWLAPIGIFALLAARVAEAGGASGVLNLLQTLGWFSVTVISGLCVHAFITLPILLRYLGKRAVIPYFFGMTEAILAAFSTASSAATLPVTLRCVKENNNVKEEIADFVLPLGATINMDGTALYEAVAAIFIAQAWGVTLGPFAIVLICLTATLASIGAAGIPEAGLVTMVIVLEAVGLPLEGIGLILAIDWFLDRCRTSVNVWGDAIGAAVVANGTKSIS